MRVTKLSIALRLAALVAPSVALGMRCNASSTWTELADIPGLPRQENTAVGINSTTLAILGGLEQFGAEFNNTRLVTYYDIPSDTWTEGPPLPIGLNHPNAAAVGGKIYLLGGLAVPAEGPWTAIPESWVLDPDEGEWQPVAPFPNGTQRGSAVVAVRGTTVYLAGGLRSLDFVVGGLHDTVDEFSAYDTATDEWTSFPDVPLPEPRDHAGGALVGSTLYVTGGRHLREGMITSDATYTIDVDDLEAGWALDPVRLPTPRGGHMVGVVGKHIFTFGGEGSAEPGSDGVFDDVEVFDTEAGSWEVLDPMPVPRHGTFAVSIGGKVYIPGGGIRQGPSAVNTLDVFTP